MTQKNNPTIEQDITQLEKMVAWFEGDDFVLEEALTQYKKAETLAQDISRRLEEVKNTVTTIADK